jgi:molecular chaperone GrpE
VVQINIEEEGKSDDKPQDISEEGEGEQQVSADEQEPQVTIEVPPEDMEKPELLIRLREVQATADNNFDLFIRSQAEIENLKKRFQKEKSELAKFSHESIIKQLLPVMDNLEKAILASQDENPIDAVRQGVELTLKGLKDVLERSGLKQVETDGELFDPNFHEAMFEQENNTVKQGTILHTLQTGYTLNDRLIRPAMVVVSRRSD